MGSRGQGSGDGQVGWEGNHSCRDPLASSWCSTACVQAASQSHGPKQCAAAAMALHPAHLDIGVEQGGQARGQHVAVAAARAPARLDATGRNVGAQRLEARRQRVLRGEAGEVCRATGGVGSTTDGAASRCPAMSREHPRCACTHCAVCMPCAPDRPPPPLTSSGSTAKSPRARAASKLSYMAIMERPCGGGGGCMQKDG